MRSLTYFLTSIFLVTLRIQNFLIVQFWSLSDLVSEYRVRFDRSIKKYFHFRSKSIKKWHLISQFQTFFFEKNFLLEIVWFVKITDFFFDLPKFFSFSSWPPISNYLKFSKKLNFSKVTRSWTLVMVPLFSVNDFLSKKLTIFWIWPNLKLSIFNKQLIWPNLLYLGNPEDLGNGVGDFFGHEVIQIPNIETVFESELIWNFFCHALPNLLFNVNFLGHLEDSKLFNRTVLVTKWPSFRIPR